MRASGPGPSAGGVPLARPPAPLAAGQGAECFANAALDATGTASITSAHLAKALDDPDLTRTPEWRI